MMMYMHIYPGKRKEGSIEKDSVVGGGHVDDRTAPSETSRVSGDSSRVSGDSWRGSEKGGDDVSYRLQMEIQVVRLLSVSVTELCQKHCFPWHT